MKGTRGIRRAALLALALWLAIGGGLGLQEAAEAAPGASGPLPGEYVFDGMTPADSYYFDQVMDVAVDGDGNVYTAEWFAHRIKKLSPNGAILGEWTGEADFTPRVIAVDEAGYLYAATINLMANVSNVQKMELTDDAMTVVWQYSVSYASGLAVDSENGVLYVAGYDQDENDAVVLLNLETGTVIESWTEFMDDSESTQLFEGPNDVAVDGEGNVYVADRSNRIVKLNSYGAYLDVLDGAGAVNSFSSIAVDAEGGIFAVDYSDNRIAAFDSSFGLLESIGGFGLGPGEFDSPSGIAVSEDGWVYVAESSNRRVQKLAADTLASAAVWGTSGSAEGRFFIPEGIAVDGEGHVYVADQGNERIQMFDRELQFVVAQDGGGASFSPYGLAVDDSGSLYITSEYILLRYDPATGNIVQVNHSEYLSSDVRSVAVDAEGFIYVADTAGQRIVKFDSDGDMVLEMQGAWSAGYFYFRPESVAVDSGRGLVYAADGSNIQLFDTDGEHLSDNWGEPEGGAFGYISGIALDRQGNLFVADRGNNRIQKFNPDGELIVGWGANGTGEGEFGELAAIAVDRAGYVYVTESGNHRVQRFAPAAHVVSFESNGGTAVGAQSVRHREAVAEPSSPTRTGYTFGGWYADSELKTAYAFATLVTREMTLYAKWTAAAVVTPPPGGGSHVPSPADESDASAEDGAGLFINGKPGQAEITNATDESGRKVTEVRFDWSADNRLLAGDGSGAIVAVQSPAESEALTVELSAALLKMLAETGGKLELRTSFAIYSIDADRIELEALLKQLGPSVRLEDVIVRIEVSRSAEESVRMLEAKAAEQGFEVLAAPVYFGIVIKFGEKQLEAGSFNGYVERTIIIPEGGGRRSMTTGVVVEADGAVRHVPTKLTTRDGVYAGVVHSLTNSDYALIGYEAVFKDMDAHWSSAAVHDMGSRLIAFGVGDGLFEPERTVTRAEFAALLVRAMGLPANAAIGQGAFSDVGAEAWYAGVVGTAHEYGLISGYDDGSFRPSDSVMREQAMKMIANAMSWTGLLGNIDAGAGDGMDGGLLSGFDTEGAGEDSKPGEFVDEDASEYAWLAQFTDAGDASAWAREALNAGVAAGILTGNMQAELAPKKLLSRAEAAVMIQRLLAKSGLI